MAGNKSGEFLDEDFLDEDADFTATTTSSGNSDEDISNPRAPINLKAALTRRRMIDEFLEERKLQKRLGDYDYDDA